MMCPVCKRDLAPTLSICLTCGAMMNDTVREELESKIGRISGPLAGAAEPKPQLPREAVTKSEPRPIAPPPPVRTFTGEFASKKTSPTLVEFQSRNATLPDWRLQLQNTVRQRTGGARQEAQTAEVAPVQKPQFATHGAAALKTETSPSPESAAHSNARVANALKRIEASRRTFLPEAPSAPVDKRPAANRNHPFNIVSRTQPSIAAPAAARPAVEVPRKPKLVSSLRIEKKGFDTNKLPPLPKPASLSSSFDSQDEPLPIEEFAIPRSGPVENSAGLADERHAVANGPLETDEIDDLAPFSMRFGSGVFDFILSGIATMVILSPFMVSGGTWFSFSGVLTFVATLSIFLFFYLTASISFWGRTFGMRLFSLELIDAEQNAYPSVHQAAVSSAVFLLSIAFGGLGFLTVLFNEERRAIHDIVSGTLLIREV